MSWVKKERAGLMPRLKEKYDIKEETRFIR
jgi:hypothetical protein